MSIEQEIRNQHARSAHFLDSKRLLEPLLEMIPLLNQREIEIAIGRSLDELRSNPERSDLQVKAAILMISLKNRGPGYQPPKLHRLMKFTDAENFMSRFISIHINLPPDATPDELRSFAEDLSR